MDIDFSEVTGADAYEIEIVNYYGELTLLVVAAPANRVEWYGNPGGVRTSFVYTREPTTVGR